VSPTRSPRGAADANVRSVQAYTGTSSPYNFNGLVRHYYLRRGTHQADLQVNLAAKDERRLRATPSRCRCASG
jgi:hypothetical protein